MDLQYSSEDLAFQDEVRRWLREHLPREPQRTPGAKKQWHRALYDAGFVGMGWPREYGGWERRPMEQAIVAEEMARHNAPPPMNYMGIATAGPTIIHHGTRAQKRRFLRNILTADELWCQLFSEPNAGSDLASLQCRADIDGDTFVVNGQKIWTSSANEADWGLLLARTDRAARKHAGISAMLVDMRSPGIDVRALKQITGVEEEFAEVFFTNVVVPVENLVGELNTGWQVAQTPLIYERGAETMLVVGRLQQQFSRLLDVTTALRRDGASAIEHPATRQKLGSIAAELEVLRYASLRTLSRIEKGEHPGPEASIAKLHWTELDKRAQELMVEILGPYGQQVTGIPSQYALDVGNESGDRGDWPYFLGWAYAGTIYAGSSQIQRNIIGERVLGLPKEARADRLAQQS
ncbi:MAG TPA: acyl-CoA dehydrogenase family protein [Thermomicrobiales bacterium]|nr:acyl-CoA dehydrogenase family protein [Thermomicrobiales bacterium]